MTEKTKWPPTSSGEAAAEVQQEEQQNNRIIPFPGIQASCTCCGTFSFRGETWAEYCPECQKWIAAGEHMTQAARLLREVMP